MTTIITPLLVPVKHEAPSDLLFLLVDDMGTGNRRENKALQRKPSHAKVTLKGLIGAGRMANNGF